MMIIYKSCNQVDKSLIFQAFEEGFSDYMIKSKITESQFFDRFFGPEGNNVDYSYIALEDSKGIGLILGGIRKFDGLKTMRCGTMCVSPSYRKQGIAKKLMELHKTTAIEEKCNQLFLEFIVGNDKAINFYKKLGYNRVYDIAYYSMDDFKWLKDVEINGVEEIGMKELKKFRNTFSGIHINWQNEMEFIEKTKAKHYGLKKNGEIIGAISSLNGIIFFIGMKKEFRNRGMSKKLIKIIIDGNVENLRVSFSNNSSLDGYFRKMKFKKDTISQYEMYQYL
jgi:GNAT superfamily N-acetyltransferase